MAPFIEPMTFIERLSNLFLTGIMDLYMTYTDSIQVESLREHFGNDVPDFYTIMKERSAFSLANSHFVTHGSWPLYPNIVEIGGIHCKPGKELPPDIKDFMDAHPEGVAYVSFGSALSPSAMTDGQKSVFRETFTELKNVPIIWKWDDDDLSGIPKNVMVRKWLPQNDLLAHPNLKAFVTHGGLLSTQEALFHNVPLVGVPISNDQKPNLLRAQRHGYAIMLSLQTMTKEDLKSAINKAMTDEDMRASIKKMHDLFTDEQDESPVERGVRAVEYVIKHNGADFLKPTATMSMAWYEQRGFDIFIFVVLVVSLSCFITLKLCCCCIRRCCYKKSKQD
jgi:glucuronosyltransferase